MTFDIFTLPLYTHRMSRKLSRSQLLGDAHSSTALLKTSTSRDCSDSESEADCYHMRPSKSCPRSCSCEEYVKIKKSSSKSVTFGKKHKCDQEELATRRQKLEMMLSRIQMEEAQSMESHNELQMRFDRVEGVLEAVLNYVDCVRLETQAAHKLCRSLNGLIMNERAFTVTEAMTHVLKMLCEPNKLEDHASAKTKIYAALDSTRDLENLFDEYSLRKRDFNTGLLNFKMLLENMTLNHKELDRLQRQFDDVLLNFQHSRYMVDQELPRATACRLQVLAETMTSLGVDLEKTGENRADLVSLFSCLGGCLKGSREVAETDDVRNPNGSTKCLQCSCSGSGSGEPS